MYHTQLGSFLTRDPLPQQGEPDVLYDNNEFGRWLDMMKNLYGYTSNNPINRTDPSGLFCQCTIKGSKGLLYVDPCCKGVLALWVIAEAGLVAPSHAITGQWMEADGFVYNGNTFKIDGSTCVTITCKPGGGADISTCINHIAWWLGKKPAYPVPGLEFGPEKAPDPGAPTPLAQ